MANLILARNTAKGKLAWLAASDAKHFYLAIQDADWRKPVFKSFATNSVEFKRVCKELKQ